MDPLTSVPEVIDALDGFNAVRRLVGARSHQRVFNWKTRGRFPSETYLVLKDALAARGKTADPSLWGLTQPSPAMQPQVSA